MITIAEFPTFQAHVGDCISLQERDELFNYLARFPDSGDEIPGTGGIRKLRWNGKGKGKRGGLRVIYYFYNKSAPVFVLTVYGKGSQENITAKQKSDLTKLVQKIKLECKKSIKNENKAQYR